MESVVIIQKHEMEYYTISFCLSLVLIKIYFGRKAESFTPFKQLLKMLLFGDLHTI
jgi:hypothetical protein